MPGHWGRSSSSGSRGSAAPGGTGGGGGGWSPGVGGKQHQPKQTPKHSPHGGGPGTGHVSPKKKVTPKHSPHGGGPGTGHVPPVVPKGRTHPGGIHDSRMDRWKKHAEFTHYLKYLNTKNYHQLGGLDFKTRFSSLPNWAAKGLGYGYQGITEGLRGIGGYLTGDPGALSDAYSRALEEGRLNALGIEQFGTGSPLEQKYLAERDYYETLARGGLAGLYRYGGFI